MHQRGSVSFGLIVLLCCGGFAVWFVVEADDPADRPAVSFQSVDVQPTRAHTWGTSLAVEIELEVGAPMPHVAPHLIVAARCDGQVDDEWAFFQTLSNAEPGDRKVETVQLFRVPTLERPPTQCELTLSLTEGATPPQRYCYAHGKTRAGRC